MTFAQSERSTLCELLHDLGPDAPTLCAGWTTADLAAHLWIRETDPVGATGMFAAPLADVTNRRMADALARYGYDDLVAKLRGGPIAASVFAFPGMDQAGNAMEYLIHTEDVRRAQDPPLPPRELDPADETWLWKRLGLMGRVFYRRAPVGVLLERSDVPGESLRVKSGDATVTLLGKPSELVLHAYGRGAVAAVERIGEPDDVAALEAQPNSV